MPGVAVTDSLEPCCYLSESIDYCKGEHCLDDESIDVYFDMSKQARLRSKRPYMRLWTWIGRKHARSPRRRSCLASPLVPAALPTWRHRSSPLARSLPGAAAPPRRSPLRPSCLALPLSSLPSRALAPLPSCAATTQAGWWLPRAAAQAACLAPPWSHHPARS